MTETYTPTTVSHRSPTGIVPLWNRGLMIIRFTLLKYEGWMSGLAQECKSQLELPLAHQSQQRYRDIPGGPGIIFKSRWQFNSRRGAILLMHEPRMTRVPDEFFSAPESLHLPVLKGKYVVYQVWNCPGYYMYLSSRGGYSGPLRVLSDDVNFYQRRSKWQSACGRRYPPQWLQVSRSAPM